MNKPNSPEVLAPFKVGDEVMIWGIPVVVGTHYLEMPRSVSFEDFWAVFGIDSNLPREKDEQTRLYLLCSEAYGYEPETDDGFPEYRGEDMEAANKLIEDLRSRYVEPDLHEALLLQIRRANAPEESLSFEINGYPTRMKGHNLFVGCNVIRFDQVERVYKEMLKYQGKHDI